MIKVLTRIIYSFILILLVTPFSWAGNGTDFRDQVIAHFFDSQAKLPTIGTEIEFYGMSSNDIIQTVQSVLGGDSVEEIQWNHDTAWLIHNTRIGTVRVESFNMRKYLNKYKALKNPHPLVEKCLECIVNVTDRFISASEIVTQPLTYHQTLVFAGLLDELSRRGAKGTNSFGQLLSFQINLGLDPSDSHFIKTLLRNYYLNGDLIRDDIAPHWARGKYIQKPKQDLLDKLDDPTWEPSLDELFDAYIQSSHTKLSRLNVMNAFLMNPSIRERFRQPEMEKPLLPRPTAEFREADSVFSSSKPELARMTFLRELQFALALYKATEKGVLIDYNRDRKVLELYRTTIPLRRCRAVYSH